MDIAASGLSNFNGRLGIRLLAGCVVLWDWLNWHKVVWLYLISIQLLY
jgi:hypothetical protein